MATAGYSGTPLPKKLGIKDGATVALIGAPDDFDETLGTDEAAFPVDVAISDRITGHHDVIVAFFTERAELERIVAPLGDAIFPDGGLWIAWPKKASKVATDMTEDVVREVALPLGLVDNKVCAIDAT